MALRAGSAIVDITPSGPCMLAGYAARDHAHECVHDRLSLRALYVSGSEGDGLVLSADIIWFLEDGIERMLPVLERELGLLPENVMFFGTHTHSAPNPSPRQKVNAEWRGMLERQVVAAAALAKNRLVDVTVCLARGTCGIGVNRREETAEGKVILGVNPDGPCDRELIVASFEDKAKKPVGRIANFACHGTTLSQRNYELSGDWMGVAAASIEDGDSGAFLFVNGGAGNVCPWVDRQESFEPVVSQADQFEALYRAVLTGLKKPKSGGGKAADEAVHGIRNEISLPRKLRDVQEGMGRHQKMTIQGLRIGPVRIVGFPGEVFSQTSAAVKELSQNEWTMVASYASGGSAGYVPVAEAYVTGGYEVRVSPYSEDAEAILRKAFGELVEELAG